MAKNIQSGSQIISEMLLLNAVEEFLHTRSLLNKEFTVSRLEYDKEKRVWRFHYYKEFDNDDVQTEFNFNGS